MTDRSAPARLPWYDALRDQVSRGALAPRATSLAGLHARRQATGAQHFTPSAVAAAMWSVAQQAMERAFAREPEAKVAIFDPAIGNGRLFQFADPARHVLAGCDIDAAAVEPLAAALDTAGFTAEILHADMAHVRAEGFGASILNPPFSLALDAPSLKPTAGVTHPGRHGDHSAALSDRYALALALGAAEVVVALLPRAAARDVRRSPWAGPRLQAVLHVPADAFVSEGARVATSILVFGRDARSTPPLVARLADLPTLRGHLDLDCCTTTEREAWLRSVHLDCARPTIKAPASGDARVRIYRHGRYLRLSFRDAFTEAKVLNGLLRQRIKDVSARGERVPAGVHYTGQALLDLEAHLTQTDPVASYRGVLTRITELGGVPEPDAAVEHYLRRRARLHRRRATPFARWTYRDETGLDLDDMPHGAALEATTARRLQLDPMLWGSPILPAGTAVRFMVERADEAPRFVTVGSDGRRHALTADVLRAAFVLPKGEPGWEQTAQGRLVAFPELAHAIRKRMVATGVDRFLSWGFQADDACELVLGRGAAVGSWQMALGKSRLAAALCLLGGGRANLIATEPHIVDEFVTEFARIGLPHDAWQVIDGPDALTNLRRINLVAYSRLRCPVFATRPRYTYARALRRRIHTVVADEGHLLRHRETDQTRALWMVSGKVRFGLTGTLIANFARDALAVIEWLAGDGTALNPYGRRHHYMSPDALKSLAHCPPGIDAFMSKWTTTTWVTHTWRNSGMVTGGKREIPRLRDPAGFQAWLAPFVKRRVQREPEVAKHVTFREASRRAIEADWDDDHLDAYIAVAESFAAWYREERLRAGADGRALNMITVLARVGAVLDALNEPQKTVGDVAGRHALASKQRLALDRVAAHVEDGHKVLLVCHSPRNAERFAAELDAAGIRALAYHGGQPIRARNRRLREEFREGEAQVICATTGTTDSGLNIPEASRVVFYDRAWCATTEEQVLFRVLRAQQTREVEAEFLHLPGSLDVYMAQVVDSKFRCAATAIDHAAPQSEADAFCHMDTILARFVEDTLGRTYRRREVKDVA